MIIIISKFIIYLHAQLSSQLPVTESVRIQTTAAAIRQHGQNKQIESVKVIYIYTLVSKNIYQYTNSISSRSASV
jgi:hypothetical protein